MCAAGGGILRSEVTSEHVSIVLSCEICEVSVRICDYPYMYVCTCVYGVCVCY